MKKTISFGLIAVLSAFVLLGAYALPEYGENAKVSSEDSISGKVESVKGVSEVEEIETEVREVERESENNDFKYIPMEQVNLGDSLGQNGTNMTMPGNNTNMTNITYVSGCNTLSPEIYSAVGNVRATGGYVVTQELERVNRTNYLLIPGNFLRVVTVANDSVGFANDQVVFREVLTGADFEGAITSEGVGNVVIDGQTYSFTYVRNLADEGYVKVNFPQTPVGQIMTFNCNFPVVATPVVNLNVLDNEVLRGENLVFTSSYPESYAGISNTGFTFNVASGNESYNCDDWGNNSCDFLTSNAYIQNGTVHRILMVNTSLLSQQSYTFKIRAEYGEFTFSSLSLTATILPNDLVGDINHDGRVNELDLAILNYVYGQQHTGEADLNGDGRVDFVDLNLLLSNWTG